MKEMKVSPNIDVKLSGPVSRVRPPWPSRVSCRITARATDAPSGVLNRWIGAMIHLFRPQIAALLQARDETVMAWRRRRRTHVFEDPRLEITSSLDIQLDTQLALVDRALDRSDDDAFRRVPALPPMAEGWGEGHAG